MAAGFRGYPRAWGRPGTRNHLLILSVTGLTSPTARRIAGMVEGALCLTTGHGSGLLGEDRVIHERVLQGFARHPNVGAVLVVGGDQAKVEAVAEAARAAGRLVEALILDDCGHDALTLTGRGVRAAASLRRTISRQRREELPLAELALGLECGRSDPSSGLVANPLVGRLAETVVDEGGVAMIGETTEWIGAEPILAENAATPEVARAIREAAARREAMAVAAGIDLTGNNPSRTNIEAGLSSIEEKSLGAVAKIGSRPIRGVLAYGEAPAGPGAWVMDAPAYAPESLTGFAAAGCNLAVFTTGVGNSYTSALMPTLKLTANPATAARLHQQLDFEVSAVFEGRETLETATQRLLDELGAIASGGLSWGEVMKDSDEVISRFGAVL